MVDPAILLGGELVLLDPWLADAEATAMERAILAEITPRQESIVLFGRQVLQPRLSLWMGDAAYRYSGRRFEPEPWTPAVRELRQRVEERAGCRFNSVLVNLYRDGRDAMGMHADDEPELGPRPVIASVSFGAARRFVMKPKRANDMARRELLLRHGSLLVMKGDTQRTWLHAVPRAAHVQTSRLNLTFREILRPSG